MSCAVTARRWYHLFLAVLVAAIFGVIGSWVWDEHATAKCWKPSAADPDYWDYRVAGCEKG